MDTRRERLFLPRAELSLECRSSCARQLRVAGTAVLFFEATELCRRKAANLTWAFTRARNAPTLFFFFFPDPTPDEQRNFSLKALFTTNILFMRESIPYFLRAALTMPSAFFFLCFPKYSHSFYCLLSFLFLFALIKCFRNA